MTFQLGTGAGVGGMETFALQKPRTGHRPLYPTAAALSQRPPPDPASTVTVTDPLPMRTKAFVCPLFSCSRMFKQTDHLKRHLMTHTLERPYACFKCKKRFSSNYNLNQHVRTHGMGEMGEMEFPEALSEIGTPDLQMCEILIHGNVQEVQDDEEGLTSRLHLIVIPSTSLSFPLPAPFSGCLLVRLLLLVLPLYCDVFIIVMFMLFFCVFQIRMDRSSSTLPSFSVTHTRPQLSASQLFSIPYIYDLLVVLLASYTLRHRTRVVLVESSDITKKHTLR